MKIFLLSLLISATSYGQSCATYNTVSQNEKITRVDTEVCIYPDDHIFTFNGKKIEIHDVLEEPEFYAFYGIYKGVKVIIITPRELPKWISIKDQDSDNFILFAITD